MSEGIRKKPYVKPTIKKISFSGVEGFNGGAGKQATFTDIEGCSIQDLVRQYGSPLFVVAENVLRHSYRLLHQAFKELYTKSTIAYSYKTNYLSAICAVLHSEGAWAEVVSGLEYEMARNLHVDGSRIIFNGPCKKSRELERAFMEGAAVNIDSFDELEAAEAAGLATGKKGRVGVRVNMQLNHPAWDKFGFSLEGGEAFEACRRIAQSRSLHLAGLHCHAGTYIIDLGVYRKVMENLVSLAMNAQTGLDAEWEYLDIGGGFPSRNTLNTMLMHADTLNPPLTQYAGAVCGVLNRRLHEFKKPPRLLLEPGRSVVDECMSLLTTVCAVKKNSEGLRFAIVDAGVNLLPTAFYYRHDLAIAGRGPAFSGGSDSEDAGKTETIDIFGPLCMQIDVLRRQAQLPEIVKGDILMIRNAGAYNFSQSMQFINPRPAIVLLNRGDAHIIRRAERYEDIKGLEDVPKRLMKAPAEE